MQMRDECAKFLLALQFLTRIPVNTDKLFTNDRMAEAPRYYPLVGVVVGVIAAVIYKLCTARFPDVVALLLSVAATLLLTGAFHEDGLADTFDGIGGGTDRERRLAIMRDSRVGVFGLLALCVVLALKVTVLLAMQAQTIVWALIVGHAFSRYSSVLAIATSNYARDDGTGKPVANGIGATGFFIASLSIVVLLLLAAWFMSSAFVTGATVGCAVGHIAARLLFEHKIGGYTGDCLGAVQQISEMGIYLGVLAWL